MITFSMITNWLFDAGNKIDAILFAHSPNNNLDEIPMAPIPGVKVPALKDYPVTHTASRNEPKINISK
ncbi:hypothetical protein [Burkholderia pseudomallei]|uniref:hypothetical protein n=1 Tax=Burkholderia pseudomallei TaxID=28450 RepID=UPI001300A105|nr:hypothetical protein [Burkholderia pseudomallei]QGT03577.1 hypothetical protein D286_03720 [Burkholderia pseudomallei]